MLDMNLARRLSSRHASCSADFETSNDPAAWWPECFNSLAPLTKVNDYKAWAGGVDMREIV